MRSALMVLSPTGKGPKDEIVHRTGRQYVDPNGHGAGFPVHPKNRFDAETVHDWMDYDALRERLGDARVEGPLTNGHATVFPNFSYLPVNGSIRIWHPKGPDEMEVWAWTIVDKSMPEEVREAQRLYNLRTFGPSGIFEQDDGENWCGVPGHRAWLHHQRRRPELPDGHGVRARGRHPPRHDQRALQRRRRPVLLRPLARPDEHPGLARGDPMTIDTGNGVEFGSRPWTTSPRAKASPSQGRHRHRRRHRAAARRGRQCLGAGRHLHP